MFAVVDNISGFAFRGKVKVFREGEPLPFYIREGKGRFNLPKGEYDIKCDEVKRLRKPVRMKLPRLAKRDRFDIPLPESITVEYVDNPNKMSIFLRDGEIFADPHFLDYPSYVRTFVFFHEIGHYFYYGEHNCDLFSARKMLERGYNQSQIRIAQNLTLSGRSQNRCNFLQKELKK